MSKTTQHQQQAVTPAGYRMGPYAKLCGMSRAHLYHQEIQPHSIVLSRRKNGRAAVRIITEQPADYLRRLAEYRGSIDGALSSSNQAAA